MNDDMSDLAPALLMTVIIAIGFVAFEFRSLLPATPAQTGLARIETSKAGQTNPQLAMNDRLYWIR